MPDNKIMVEYNQERLKALLKFAAKKNINVQTELENTLDKLYQKVVPPQVKEYLEGE